MLRRQSFFPHASFLFVVGINKLRNVYLTDSELHGHDKQNIKNSTLEGVDIFGYAWHGDIKINRLQKTQQLSDIHLLPILCLSPIYIPN